MLRLRKRRKKRRKRKRRNSQEINNRMYAPIRKIVDFIKKQPRVWLVVSLFLILICVILVGGYLLLTRTSFLDLFSREKIDNTNQPQAEEQKPVFNFYRLIDGVGVDAEEAVNQPIFAAQIENLVDARPLSGISRANLVYETLAEGGITRILALFTAKSGVDEIGPVRSARPYFLSWAEEYGALYAHSGGSPEALNSISKYDILDLNEFSNGQYFWRSRARYAPHNLYTSTGRLAEAFTAKEGKVKSDFDAWQFKDETELDGRPSEARRVKIYFSSKSYEVGWQYARESNDYLRYQAGTIEQDRDGKEVKAKNIAVQFAKITSIDAIDRKKIETVGEGEAIVFQDGIRIDGTWRKEAKGGRTKFYGSAGVEIKFNPGVTWVEVVPVGAEVEW